MGDVRVDRLQTGMLLASDLRDSFGRMLLRAGTVVEEQHLRIMKMWGVNTADIAGVEPAELAEQELNRIPPDLLLQLRRHTDSFFPESGPEGEHPLLAELRQISMVRLAQRIAHKTLDLQRLEKADYFPELSAAPPEPAPSLEQLAEKRLRLASLPDIYHRIMEALNDPKSSATHLARVVSQDPGVSAALLKIVNSAYYGLPVKVASIPRAIALIGGREVGAMAMGVSVIRFFKDIPPHVIDMKRFWLHSVAAGALARCFASQKNGLHDEDFFIAGLLHDIGRLILFGECPNLMTEAIRQARLRRIPLRDMELEIFGYDHAQTAEMVMEKWNFPKILRQCIRRHHEPQLSPAPRESAIICLANLVSNALQYGYSGDDRLAPLAPGVWESLELPPAILANAIQQTDRQIGEVLHAFALD